MKKLVLLGCVLSLVACGDDGNDERSPLVGGNSGSDCPKEGLGTLDIRITGLPDQTAAAVEAGGRAVTASEQIDFNAGEVAIEAEPVTPADPLIRSHYRPTVEPASVCIRDGETSTVQIVYELVPTSGKLWATTKNEASGVVGFDRDQLATAGEKEPFVQTHAGAESGGQAPVALAFDQEGNGYFAYAVNQIHRYSAAKLAGGGDPDPDVVLKGEALGGLGLPGPVALAFDGEGNLWASVAVDDAVVKLPASSLAQSGEAQAEVSLGGDGSSLDGPGALAFDGEGNLWVAFDGKLGRYDASTLAASTSEGPDLAISVSLPDGGGTMGAPAGLAFDAEGNLWGTYFGPNLIARLDAAELQGDGDKTVEPEVRIQVGLSALLGGIAFDESGGLLVALGAPGVGRYTPDQLETEGDKSPAIVVGGTNVNSLAIFPSPAGLPLLSSLPAQQAQ